MKTQFLLGLLALTAVLAFVKPEPFHSRLADLVPTPDPCGYAPGSERCVRHRLICPVW